MTQVTNTLFTKHVFVNINERALVLKNGKFLTILEPGRHRLLSIGHKYQIVDFNLTKPVFVSDYADALIRKRPDLVDAHFTVVKTGATEVAVVSKDGKAIAVQKPDSRTMFWKDAGPWTVEHFELPQDLTIEKRLADRIKLLPTTSVKNSTVNHGMVGLLFIDGNLIKTMTPGAYAFWNVGREVTVKLIDTRQHAIDVTGQEILTKDRVSVRVNLSATYRVVDPVKAVTDVKDFEDALYRALQYAFRQILATRTLDALLAQKGSVDNEAAKAIRKDMAAIGLDVSAITIKDVVLPGEMRDILNTVVTAEKEAEANVIRRREETQATRALLNTAKLMTENPAMLRLKELEALEAIAEKVDRLTVHNGTRGLLNDIVSLKD